MDCEYITVHSNKQKYIFTVLNISYFNNLCNKENRQNIFEEVEKVKNHRQNRATEFPFFS